MEKKMQGGCKMHLGGGGRGESWSVLGEGYRPAWDNACQNAGSEDDLQLSPLLSGDAASASGLLDQLKCENLRADRSSIRCLTFKYSLLSYRVASSNPLLLLFVRKDQPKEIWAAATAPARCTLSSGLSAFVVCK